MTIRLLVTVQVSGENAVATITFNEFKNVMQSSVSLW